MRGRTTECKNVEYDRAFNASVSNEQTLNLPTSNINDVKHSYELRLVMLACHYGI